MARFSDRIGVTKPSALARDGMSPELQTALWNLFYQYIFETQGDGWVGLARAFYEFHHFPLNTFLYDADYEQRVLHDWWFSSERQWWEFYNTIEHFSAALAAAHRTFYKSFNNVFAREGARYRFVDGVLAEITDENEIAAVNEVLAAPDRFGGAREHIASALRMLTQRPQPDYRNSIRESISAVESTLRVLTDMHHAPLGDALKAFSRAHPLHTALFRGLNSLYGYTSNEHGIRHALIEANTNVGFAEGKFMVVACAAFMNFLTAKSAA